MHRENFEIFQAFPDRSGAEILAAQLNANEVPAYIETRDLENALESRYCVCVPSRLAHRARWVAAQLPPTEAELAFLAENSANLESE